MLRSRFHASVLADSNGIYAFRIAVPPGTTQIEFKR